MHRDTMTEDVMCRNAILPFKMSSCYCRLILSNILVTCVLILKRAGNGTEDKKAYFKGLVGRSIPLFERC